MRTRLFAINSFANQYVAISVAMDNEKDSLGKYGFRTCPSLLPESPAFLLPLLFFFPFLFDPVPDPEPF
jgi:hypothetical protein